jgi:hypothetical protein
LYALLTNQPIEPLRAVKGVPYPRASQDLPTAFLHAARCREITLIVEIGGWSEDGHLYTSAKNA